MLIFTKLKNQEQRILGFQRYFFMLRHLKTIGFVERQLMDFALR